jgi:hypothetical protein
MVPYKEEQWRPPREKKRGSKNPWGMYGESSCNVLLLLFVVLWFAISLTLCRRAVLMLWHARALFLGLVGLPPPLFFVLPGGLCCFFL